MLRIKRREPVTGTRFIVFDANKCEACWECVLSCKNNVIGKINLFFHKHARIANKDECTGCLKCVKICSREAITRIEKK